MYDIKRAEHVSVGDVVMTSRACRRTVARKELCKLSIVVYYVDEEDRPDVFLYGQEVMVLE